MQVKAKCAVRKSGPDYNKLRFIMQPIVAGMDVLVSTIGKKFFKLHMLKTPLQCSCPCQTHGVELQVPLKNLNYIIYVVSNGLYSLRVGSCDFLQ